MNTPRERPFRVTFVGNYFVLTTTIIAENHEQAEANAIAILQDHHGFAVDQESRKITVETLD